MMDEQKQLLEQIERLLESEDISGLRELLADQRLHDVGDVSVVDEPPLVGVDDDDRTGGVAVMGCGRGDDFV